MPAEIQKSVSIKQVCTDCQKIVFTDHLIIDVPKDYKVSDIKNQLKTPPENCPDCHIKAIASFSFIHQERI
jgi:hypothetical protein